MSSSEIFTLRRQKRHADALAMARAEYPKNTNDIWFLRAYAWVLYDHAKLLIERYETNLLPPAALASQLSPYMHEFARMAKDLRGDSAFSQMLNLACKVSREWHEFLGFAHWAGTHVFSEDDRKPFVNAQGNTVDSLEKRFIHAICRETVARTADTQANLDLIEWGKGILEEALEADSNDQWLNYYRSKLHLVNGESEQAIKRLIPVLRRQSRVSWSWALLGKILEVGQPEDSLTCYIYASQLAREEQEVAKVRIHLAQRLALLYRFNEAAQQVSLALQYRKKNGLKVTQDLQQLLTSDWYHQAVANNSLQPLPQMEAAARALLQALDRPNLTYIRGVIDHINTEKGLSYVATGADSGVGLPHRIFPQIAELSPGMLVEVGRADPNGPALDWQVSHATVLPGLCETFSGQLVRHEGKDFAFLRAGTQDVFVPPPLAVAFTPGQQYDVACLAIKRTNKQGKTGWRALKFIVNAKKE